MFEVNKNLEVKEDYLLGSKIFTIDNFIKIPKKFLIIFLTEKFLYGKLKRVHHLMAYSLMKGG